MRNNILLKNIESAASKGDVSVRRYNLSDMISESYNICYDSAQGSNLKKLAEAHLEDVKENPTDIERLSRQMCNLKYLASMVESRKMRDSELIKKATPKISIRRLKEGEDYKESQGGKWYKGKAAWGNTALYSYRPNNRDKNKEFAEVYEKGNRFIIELHDPSGVKKYTANTFEEAQEKVEAYYAKNSGSKVKESRSPRRKLKESSSFAQQVADAYDQIYSDMMDSGNTAYGIGSDYRNSSYADKLNQIEAIFDEYGCNADDDIDVCADALPPEGKRRVASLLGIDSYQESRSPLRKLKDCNESFDDKMTPAEMRKYWDENHEDDPILARYKSYDDWYKESKKNGYVRDEDIDESEDITEEELDELANHLAEMRKKKGIKESRSPRRKLKESKNIKKVRLSRRVNEGKTFKNAGHDWEVLDTKGDYTLVHSTTKKVTPYVVAYKLDKSDGSWGQGHYFDTEKEASDYLKKVREAKSWKSIKEGMKNFSKASSSKAFYKTFKKMYESLKEGRALTRQESINLYKAANSAMTHFSVELEHNPKFLNAFNECTSLLSKDVDSLLESLKQGMAPSKYTMKSLAKFAEALLYESDEDLKYVDNVNGYKVYRKIENGKGVWFAKRQDDPDDKMFPITYEQARGYEEIAGSENIRKIRKDLGKKLLPEAFYDDYDGDDESAKREYEERKRAYEERKREYKTKGDGNDNSIFSRKEKMDLAAAHANALARQKNYPLVDVDESANGSVDDYLSKMKGAKSKAEVEKIVRNAKGNPNADEAYKKWKKSVLDESAEEEEELDDIETSIEDEEADSIDDEEDFVGDDEGDIQSEEEEKFCQEYADAREELHNDMEEKYEDTEDPGVQEKLAQDAEEVAILKGEDLEDEEGEEESPEDSEEESEEDEEPEKEDDSDITDDELAELKKHLTEMRKAKKSCK